MTAQSTPPTRPTPPPPVTTVGGRTVPLTSRILTQEIWLVFALSLGADGLRALVSLIGDWTSGQSLTAQVAVLNASRAPGRPTLDLILQLVSLATAVVPVLLVGYLLGRSGEGLSTIGVDFLRPRSDLMRGSVLAAVVGGAGLFLYLGAHALGINLTVVPESLPVIWWRIPVLLLSALQNAVLEEVLVAGYLLHRLAQLGWSDNRALATSAVLRGSYHLYQGLGGFVGNAIMGVIFGRLFQRWQRAMPLVIAHTLMDAVAFIGYAELAGHVSWLPVPG
jgi:membrane protease YdiL (CAAX protease family)